MQKGSYYIDRSDTIKISEDTKNVESECQVITFVNMGDTPVFIEVVGGIKRRLVQYQQVSFGTDIHGHMERNKFNVTFEALMTTKELHVERAKYVENAAECNI